MRRRPDYKRKQRLIATMTPEQIWTSLTDLQRVAMLWFRIPIADRYPCRRPYIKTAAPLVRYKLIVNGPDRSWVDEHNVVHDLGAPYAEATLTDLGESVAAHGATTRIAQIMSPMLVRR